MSFVQLFPAHMLSLKFVLEFCHGIAKGGDCKVEFNQPSCWLYSVPNLLVIQHLETIGASSQDSHNFVAMANSVSFASHATTPLSGIDILPHDVFDSRHSIFSVKVINRIAFENHVWVIDTGASDHIVYSVSMLTTFTSISHCVVKLPNNESTTITHVGTVQLSTQFTLHNVLCVPSFTFNLLSVSQLTKQLPFCLVFLSQFCFIQDLTCWRTIGVGEMHHGLYLLQRKLSFSSSKLVVEKAEFFFIQAPFIVSVFVSHQIYSYCQFCC